MVLWPRAPRLRGLRDVRYTVPFSMSTQVYRPELSRHAWWDSLRAGQVGCWLSGWLGWWAGAARGVWW